MDPSFAERRPRPIGRQPELDAGDRFLDGVASHSAVLRIDGEPGIGKTTIWRELVERARGRGYEILTASPVVAESGLPFAGLLDLLGERAGELLPALPVPQRVALEAALLRSDAPPGRGSPVATSAAVLSSLVELARSAPVLVAVDDLQWLDPATLRVLVFAARRLGARHVGLLVAVRVPSPLDPTVPVPDLGVAADRLLVGGLPAESLQQVIGAHLGVSLTRAGVERIEATSAGNPFFALEIARARRHDAPTSLRAMPSTLVPAPLADLVDRRIRRMPSGTRRALLLASAAARPTTELVPADDLDPAVEAGFVAIDPGGRVRFSHPLFGHAVYEQARAGERRSLHRSLAERLPDPDERALHAALALLGPDEAVARQLHEAAERARRRGAPETAAELEERAVAKTPDHDAAAVAERRLRAAEHHERAGNPARASELASAILEGPDPARGPLRARALLLLAEIAYGRDFREARQFLVEALVHAGDDPRLAAPIELNLAFAEMTLSNLDAGLEHARRAEALVERIDEPALLAEAIGIRVTLEWYFTDRIDRVALRRAIELEDPTREVTVQTRPAMALGLSEMLQGRLDEARATFERMRARVLESGEEHELPFAIAMLSFIALFSGRLDEARAYAEETERTAVTTGSETLRALGLAMRALVDAYTGDDGTVEGLAGESLAACERSGWFVGFIYALAALGFRALSRDQLADARRIHEGFLPVLGSAVGYGLSPFFASPLLDVLIASNELGTARRIADGLEAAGRSLDAPWALAVAARARVELAMAEGDLAAADAAVGEAVACTETLPIPVERGRMLLVLGVLRRRQRRKRLAHAAFVEARDLFARVGMPLWQARAEREIARLGIRPRAPLELTATERRVAELAAEGLTNREIGARVFASPRTVEDALARAYGKLGVRSRAQLGALLGGGRGTGTGSPHDPAPADE